jgi:cysteine rich repeat protein
MKLVRLSLNTTILSLSICLVAESGLAQSDLAASVREKAMAAVAKIETACGQDIKNYCSTVTPDNGRLLLCMEAHDDKLSPQCVVELHEAANKVHTAVDLLKEATRACTDDASKFCAGIKPGQGRLAQCLSLHGSNLSKPCTDAMDRLRSAAQ